MKCRRGAYPCKSPIHVRRKNSAKPRVGYNARMTSETTPPAVAELPYAMPAPSYAHKVFAGAAVLLSGLGLIVLSGCFLIGVMIITNHGFNSNVAAAPISQSALVLVAVLYALSGITFAGAVVVILSGLRGLFRVMRG